MTRTTTIETTLGTKEVSCTDEQINALPEASIARRLRDEQQDGVYVTDSEIVSHYASETK